jgi:adenylosuccinate lyase
MLNRLRGMLQGMHVYPGRMKENMKRSFGLYNSQRVMLALVEKGVSREDAYALVQRNAMKSWRQKKGFKALLRKDKAVMKHLSASELSSLFELKPFLRHVDVLFERVFGKAATRT